MWNMADFTTGKGQVCVCLCMLCVCIMKTSKRVTIGM